MYYYRSITIYLDTPNLFPETNSGNTGCGELTSFLEYEMPYEKGS
jgi:hypothetical protein